MSVMKGSPGALATGAASSFFEQPATKTVAKAATSATESASARNGCIAAASGMSGRGSRNASQADKHPVQALQVRCGIRQLAAFCQRGLIVKQLCELGELIAVGHTVEESDERVRHIELERGLRLRRLLARGEQHAAHVGA